MSYTVHNVRIKLKQGGSTMNTSFTPSLGKSFKTEYEAQKAVEEAAHKRWPKWEIVDLVITYR